MEPFLEREEATTVSQLVGILPGAPPKVNLVDYGTGRNGIKRHMTQQVPVLDADLFARLQAEVKIGEQIRATTINEYTESGSKVYLADFKKMPAPKTNDTNGTINFTTNNTTEIIVPPVRDEETIVRH